MTNLSKTGLIESIQGKYGGYRLAKNPGEISLLDIINATNDSHLDNTCFFGYSNCPLDNTCSMHKKWEQIRNQTYHILNSTGLNELND